MSTNTPIPLKSSILDELATAQLERYVTVGRNDIRRRAKVPIITDEIDPELACRVYDEFNDVASNALKFEFWRQCLAGQARAHWDALISADLGRSNANFLQRISEWFQKC